MVVKARSRLSAAQHWRSKPGALVLVALSLAVLFTRGAPLSGERRPVDFYERTDKALTQKITDHIAESVYASCIGDRLQRKKDTNPIHAHVLKTLMVLPNFKKVDDAGNKYFEEVSVLRAPCGATHDCCERTVFFRPNTTDFQVYEQIFIKHYMRYLYALFDQYKPKYVLDAGANAGFSATLFKLLWPDCTIVALEPDPSNFEVLSKNMAGQKDVHILNAGLWRRNAKIGQQANHGEWGRVFEEVDSSTKDAMQAYGVKDLARKFNIPSFDFVKIDIEGSEGVVFDPEADLSWIPAAKVVSLEIHDFFAGYFGLKDVSSRVAAAFEGLPYKVVTDNEHVMFVSNEIGSTMQSS